jgi:hypothetical protein
VVVPQPASDAAPGLSLHDKAAALALLLGIVLSPAQAGAADPVSRPTLASLQDADRRQSEIVQSGDIADLEQLLHPSYLLHAPNGRTLDRAQTLDFARSGALAKERHRRVQETARIEGTTGIVIGVDHLDAPPPLATRGERRRRYTNVYLFEGGRWKHLLRHFHFVP